MPGYGLGALAGHGLHLSNQPLQAGLQEVQGRPSIAPAHIWTHHHTQRAGIATAWFRSYGQCQGQQGRRCRERLNTASARHPPTPIQGWGSGPPPIVEVSLWVKRRTNAPTEQPTTHGRPEGLHVLLNEDSPGGMSTHHCHSQISQMGPEAQLWLRVAPLQSQGGDGGGGGQ